MRNFVQLCSILFYDIQLRYKLKAENIQNISMNVKYINWETYILFGKLIQKLLNALADSHLHWKSNSIEHEQYKWLINTRHMQSISFERKRSHLWHWLFLWKVDHICLCVLNLPSMQVAFFLRSLSKYVKKGMFLPREKLM